MALHDPYTVTEHHDSAAVSARCAATVDFAMGLDVPLAMERILRGGECWDEPETGAAEPEVMDLGDVLAARADLAKVALAFQRARARQ